MATELDAARQALARRAETEAALAEITARLTSLRDPGAVLQRTVDEAVRLVGGFGAALGLLDAEARVIRWAFDAGLDPLASRDLHALDIPEGAGVVGTAFATNSLVVTDDYPADDRFPHLPGTDSWIDATGVRSMVAVPLPGEREPLGILAVFGRERAAFAPGDITTMSTLAHQAAIALANARLIEELDRSRSALARRLDVERSLREISGHLTSVRDPQELLRLVVDEAARLIEADAVALDLVDEATGRTRWAYDAGIDDSSLYALVREGQSTDQGLVGLALERGSIVCTGEYLEDRQFAHIPEADEFMARLGIRSMIAAPLRGDGTTVGVLDLYSRQPNAFGSAELEIIGAFSDQVSIALANARLIEALATSRRELERKADAEASLREIASRLAALHEPGELLRRVVDEAGRLVAADAVALDVIDRATNRIHWTYDSGTEQVNVRELVEAGQPADIGLVGLALERGGIACTGDYLADPSFTHFEEGDAFMASMGIRSMVAAPLIGEDGPLGVLDIYSQRPAAFGDSELSIIAAFADQAAIALANARLIEQLDRSREELTRRAAAERSLGEIAARIAAARDPDLVLRMVVDEAQRLIGSDGAHLTLITDDGLELVPAVVSAGTAPETQAWLTSARFKLGEGLHGQVALRREAAWTEDSLRDRDVAEPDSPVPAGRTAIRAVAVAPLNAPEGGILGTLAISYEDARAIDDESLRLLATLADHAAVSITAGRLEEEIHVRAAELAASEERSRLARELHDSVTQALFSMTLQTRAVELLLDRDIESAREKLAALRDLQRDALAEMRSLIFELRPGGIAEQGLVHALRTHVTAIQGRIGLPVAFDTRVPAAAARPPIEVEEALYRIAQEALHNVVRHASARQVKVALVQDRARIRLVVSDDGVGFDPGAVPKGHLGLEGMRARVGRLGGRFEIASRPGGGTRIIVTIPLARETMPA